jgi:peptidoglycan hydrolase-like protein with peptidoglycan-binding domain
MGAFTIRAIENFQIAHNLVVDGIVGPKTLAMIKDQLARAPAPGEA